MATQVTNTRRTLVAVKCPTDSVVVDWAGGHHATGHALFGQDDLYFADFHEMEVVHAIASDDCDAIANENANGAIVLFEISDDCSFVQQAHSAQVVGAAAVIIFDNVPATLQPMPFDPEDSETADAIDIPVLFITKVHGEALAHAVTQGEGTTVSLHCSANPGVAS